jgi:phosphoglycerol transferase MdoB-like AlkP superfamily enzyme
LVCFLYVPGNKDIVKDGTTIKEGLIKGKQNLVRGQMDIYRSLIELFGLNTNKDGYFGTHLLSNEPTYVLDNKLQDVIMDQFIFSMRNRKLKFPRFNVVDDKIFENIKKFKILSDMLIEENEVQKRLNKVLDDTSE